MSTVKITELPQIYTLNQDTNQTLILGVDVDSGITGRITATSLGAGLYTHNQLNVGNNDIILPNVTAQFAGSSSNYLQLNLQNNDGNGSGDIVVTANSGTDATYYIDMGFNGDTYSYDGYTYAKPLDGYLIVQGNDNVSPGGNLVIGTTTAGRDVSILVGSIDDSQIMSKFVANTGFKMIRYPITFADGTTQNTAAAPFTYSNSAYTTANTGSSTATGAFIKANAAYGAANSAGVYANSALNQIATAIQDASIADGKAVTAGRYANAAFIQANTVFAQSNTNANNITVTQGVDAFQNTNIGLAFSKANNALANTTGTFAGDLTVTGNIIAKGIQTSTGPITTGNLIVNGTSSTSGTANITGQLNVTGAVSMNATLVLANSNFTATESAVTITASPTVALPVNDGYMIHISGKNGIPTRIVSDAYGTGAYSVYASRSARGTVDSPTAVQSGDIMGRFSANGYGTTKWQQFGTGRIDFIAAENYTDANTGSQIKFWNCPVGSNTLTNILTLNGDSADFTGAISPEKGFILTPNVRSGITNTLNINFATDSLYKVTIDNTATVNLSGYTTGKIVEVWMTNSSGSNRTVTHGCLATNSTSNAVDFTLPATSSAYLKYFSIDGDNANTFVSIVHA